MISHGHDSRRACFFYNVGNIVKTIFPEFQRKYLKCADPCGQHVEIGIFDSVISTFFLYRKYQSEKENKKYP